MESAFMTQFPCPKCGRTLLSCGEITDPEKGSCQVYQCDECIATATIDGEPFEIALTFAVDADGQAFNPATADGKLEI
jgi:predicted RNA-binding Zn-ribbon protein involved in translation (DUF1610 family)